MTLSRPQWHSAVLSVGRCSIALILRAARGYLCRPLLPNAAEAVELVGPARAMKLTVSCTCPGPAMLMNQAIREIGARTCADINEGRYAPMPFRWHIDQLNCRRVAGWVDDSGPAAVDISINGRVVATI